MSSNPGIVEVDKHVKIALVHRPRNNLEMLGFDFDRALHERGSDFSLYANHGYTENTNDTDLLIAIIRAVLTRRGGVSRIDVKAFSIKIEINGTSDIDQIIRQVQSAAIDAGYQVEYIDRKGKL